MAHLQAVQKSDMSITLRGGQSQYHLPETLPQGGTCIQAQALARKRARHVRQRCVRAVLAGRARLAVHALPRTVRHVPLVSGGMLASATCNKPISAQTMPDASRVSAQAPAALWGYKPRIGPAPEPAAKKGVEWQQTAISNHVSYFDSRATLHVCVNMSLGSDQRQKKRNTASQQ